MSNLVLLPAAEADYRAALAWYAERSPQAAIAFEISVQVGLERLFESPGSWPAMDERHRFYILRKFPFSLIYREEADAVLIVAVAHSSRRSEYWQQRK